MRGRRAPRRRTARARPPRAAGASRRRRRRPCAPAAPQRGRGCDPRRAGRARLRRARRARGAADRRPRRGPPRSREDQRLAADLDLGALLRAGGTQGALELPLVGRRADDAEAAVGAEDPKRAAPARLRPVDEELDHAVVVGDRLGRRRGQPQEGGLSGVDPPPEPPPRAKGGARRVGVARRRLPRPPAPPRAATTRERAPARSAISSPSSENTCVPTGTRRRMSSPAEPCLFAPRPFPPLPARKVLRPWKNERSRRSGSTSRTTSPPRPASPPSGPPFGTYFSRRKLSAPWPPRPASTRIRALSLNIARRLPLP